MADLGKIRRVYDIVDENADGLVSLDEIIGFVNKIGMPISEDDLRCMLVNDNNEEEEEESKDLMEAFKVFDQNNDGYISSTELQQVLSAMGLIPQGHDSQQCQKMICRFDSDFNGVLDFYEKKKGILEDITNDAKFQPYTLNFLYILIDKKRIDLISEIFKEFEIVHNKQTDTELAVVSSVVNLENQISLSPSQNQCN
ncbi:hypothetical protein KI387_022488, partial [Taxus chinensis]